MLFRLAFRYFSGRPLDGIARTDSSLFRPATAVFTTTGRATRWARLPGWQRAAWRILSPPALALAIWAYVLYPTATTVTGSTATAAGTWLGGRQALRYARTRKVRKRYVRPLAAVLAGPLRQLADRPDRWVYVPPELTKDVEGTFLERVALPGWVPRLPTALRRNHFRDPAIGRINVPLDLLASKEVRAAVETALAQKVHDDLIVEWNGRGEEPYVTFRARPRPPALVTFDDISSLVALAPASAPIIGMSAAGSLAVDIDTDAPHLGLSCGSGAGKSVLLRGLIAQWLHNGVQVVILDGKQTSQRWCKDLPGVRYCRTGEQMFNALIEVQGAVQHRAGIVDSYPAEIDASDIDVGPRIVVVFEEMNIGMAMISEYWDEIREKGSPKRSPAHRAWDHALAAGREFRVHAFAVAQMMTVQASGGNPAARENMGPRILARSTKKAWEMLAPECGPPYPKMTKRRGRMYLAFEGGAIEFQSALWTVKEARSWATSGDVTVPETWTSGRDLRDSTGTVTSPRFYTLADAAKQEWCTPSYAALRQHVSRARKAGNAPAGTTIGGTTKYTRDELVAMLETRPVADEEMAP